MAATGTPQVNCHNKLTQKLPQKQLKGIASYLNTICLKSSQSSTSQNEWLFFQDNFNGLTFLVDIEVVTKREKEDGAIQLGPKVNLRLPLPVSSATDTQQHPLIATLFYSRVMSINLCRVLGCWLYQIIDQQSSP